MQTRIRATMKAPERAPVAEWTRLASERKRAWAGTSDAGSALTITGEAGTAAVSATFGVAGIAESVTTGVAGATTGVVGAATGVAGAATGIAGAATGVAGATTGVAGTMTAGVA